MIYVGIGIAKLNHFASAISSDGEMLMEPFPFSNDADGFHMLLSRLNSLEPDNIISCWHLPVWIYLYTSPEIFRPSGHGCRNAALVFSDML